MAGMGGSPPVDGVSHHNQEIEIAIGTHRALRRRTEKDVANGLRRRHCSFHYFIPSRIVDDANDAYGNCDGK